MIEIADDADAARAGCPNRKVYAANALNRCDVSAEFFVGVVVTPFAHQMKIEFAEKVRECVGVVHLKRLVVLRPALDLVAAGSGRTGLAGGPGSFKESFGAKLDRIRNFRSGDRFSFDGRGIQGDRRFGSPWNEKADGPTAAGRMRTENGEGVGMPPRDERVDL